MRRDGQAAVYAISGTNIVNGLTGAFQLITIGDSQRIRWNVNNFEVVGSYTNYPVSVTWFGAAAFANFYGYDLPTEAEWEKAARGPDYDDQDEHRLYTGGNDNSPYAQSEAPVDAFNFRPGLMGQVDMKNGYGCYNMTGNAREWTRTNADYGIASYPQQEDLANERHEYRTYWPTVVAKFGCPIYYRDSVAARWNDNSQYYEYCGFRVCRRYIPEGETAGE